MVSRTIPPCEICVLNNPKTNSYPLNCLNILPNIKVGRARKQVPFHASSAAGWLCATALMSYCAAHIASPSQETRTIFGTNSQIHVVNLCIHHYIGYFPVIEYERQTNLKRTHCEFEKDGSPLGTESD